MDEGTLADRIKERAQTWFMEDGWSLRKETLTDAIWAFVAEDQSGRKIVAGQKIGKKDELVIQGAVKVDEETSSKITQLPHNEKDDFIWDLRFELLRTDLEFSGTKLPLEKVEVVGRICFDALAKDTFLQKVSQVRKGILIVQWMLARKFAKQPPKKELGFHR
jgi:hypothetical protein